MNRPAFYSQNDNQNYFVSNGRTSSRVLQQPGGSSSINLSWENHNQDGKSRSKCTNFRKDKKLQLKCNFQKDVKARSISNNSFASGSSQNTGNVLTDRPSSRVLQPPGGKSSFSLAG